MWFAELTRRVHFLMHRRAYQRELREEMRIHREFRARQLAQQTSSFEESTAAASRLFGNQALLLEKANDMWGWNWLEDFGKDLKHTGRMLMANPVFAMVAILTLALGIGANTAIFSVTNALLLRALPVSNPQQVYRLSVDALPDRTTSTGAAHTSFSYAVFQQLRSSTSAVSDVIAYVPLGFNKIPVRAGAFPEEASVQMVSGNFFTGLGVRAACGRMISMEEETAHASVAVVSYGYASGHFGSDCAALGRPVSIRGLPFTIIGVTANSFIGIGSTATDIWVPFQQHPDLNAWGSASKYYSADPGWWCLLMAARLKPGVTKTAAEASLNPVFQHAAYAPIGGKPLPGKKAVRLSLNEARGLVDGNTFEKPVLILQVMVGFLLLIACGNVSLLLAVRNAARSREFSIRLAIGGSAGRLFRQLLAEGLALTFAGALLGLFFAILATRVLARWTESDISLAPDRLVLLFTLAISIAAALVFAIAPAFQTARISLARSMKVSAATSHSDRTRISAGMVTVTVQIALCLTLLAGTGLLVRTLQNLQRVNVGFSTQGLVVFGVSPHLSKHGTDQAIAFYRGITAKLASIPQVESVTLMENRIGSGWSNNTDPFIDGRLPSEIANKLMRWDSVGPNFFQTLGVHVAQGRDFNDSDLQTAPLVAIIDRTFANRFFPGRNPIGHTVSYTKRKQYTIVGVVEDHRYTGIWESTMPAAWFPYTQSDEVGAMHVELRTKGNSPAAVLSAARKTLADFAPDLAVLQPRTQQAEFDRSIADQHLLARVSVSFAVLAIVLVTTGLYGTISYNVSRRTSELGLRMALGAERNSVLWMILRGGLLLCLAGTAIGLPLAAASSRILSSLLYGVGPTDPVSVAVAVCAVLSVGLVATYLPARRAAAIDPMIALRHE